MHKYRDTIALFLFLLPSLCYSSGFLVDSTWLKSSSNKADIRIIDMSDNIQYQRFHIPGAVHLPYAALNQRNKKGVSFSVPQQQLVKILGFLGIKASTHIVIYDDMGGLNAARLFWELEKLGHKKVSVLNGGLVKWILEGHKVTADITPVTRTQYQPVKISQHNNISLDEIRKLDLAKTTLLDVRTKEEYLGHPRQKRSGHIPGAKWWEWQQAVNFDSAFQLHQDNLLKKLLNQGGVKNKNDAVVVYCRSGHRAAHSYFVLRQLGFNNIKLYDGSMAEYEQVKNAPLKKGAIP